MPEIRWTGDPPDPEPFPRPQVVTALVDMFTHLDPSTWLRVVEALGAEEYEVGAAMGPCVDDLNARKADIDARLAEIVRLFG